jgi:hypothetical protein
VYWLNAVQLWLGFEWVGVSLAYESQSFLNVGLWIALCGIHVPCIEVVLRMRAIVNTLKMTHAAAGIPQQHGY